MEFTEAESNMNDLVSEYQQYQDATAEVGAAWLGGPGRSLQRGIWSSIACVPVAGPLCLPAFSTPCISCVPRAHLVSTPMLPHPAPFASLLQEEGEAYDDEA